MTLRVTGVMLGILRWYSSPDLSSGLTSTWFEADSCYICYWHVVLCLCVVLLLLLDVRGVVCDISVHCSVMMVYVLNSGWYIVRFAFVGICWLIIHSYTFFLVTTMLVIHDLAFDPTGRSIICRRLVLQEAIALSLRDTYGRCAKHYDSWVHCPSADVQRGSYGDFDFGWPCYLPSIRCYSTLFFIWFVYNPLHCDHVIYDCVRHSPRGIPYDVTFTWDYIRTLTLFLLFVHTYYGTTVDIFGIWHSIVWSLRNIVVRLHYGDLFIPYYTIYNVDLLLMKLWHFVLTEIFLGWSRYVIGGWLLTLPWSTAFTTLWLTTVLVINPLPTFVLDSRNACCTLWTIYVVVVLRCDCGFLLNMAISL